MKHVWIVFRKEMIYTLRDRRTLLVMVVIPLLLFPSILIITSTIQKSAIESEAGKTLRVAFHGESEQDRLLNLLHADPTLRVTTFPDTTTFREGIRTDSFDLAMATGAGFATAQKDLASTEIFVWYDQTKDLTFERGKMKVDLLGKIMLQERLDSLGLTPAAIEPLKLVKRNTASTQETIGKLAGGFLPYIFIAFCYMGCMFPAIDLFTGEKERGTIETILSTPVDRWKLLAGKMLVVVSSGLTTAFLALFGLFVGMNLSETLPPELMDVVLGVLSPTFLLLFFLMLIPLVTAFAGLMIPATVFAKSYKEAQSILSPLNFVVILPAIVGMMPGVELNFGTACVPVLNVVLATKDLIAGSINPLHFILTMFSLLVVAAVAVLVSFKRFGNESNVLRT